MITTLPSDRIHRPPGMSPEGEYHWASAMLPPATGAFLIDLDWSETSFKRTQSLLCPATTDAVSGMHVHEIAILDIMYIPSPQHDGTGREPVLRVNAIDRALVPERGFVEVLLVRTLDGNWHACDRHVNLDTLEDRAEMLRVGGFSRRHGLRPSSACPQTQARSALTPDLGQ